MQQDDFLLNFISRVECCSVFPMCTILWCMLVRLHYYDPHILCVQSYGAAGRYSSGVDDSGWTVYHQAELILIISFLPERAWLI